MSLLNHLLSVGPRTAGECADEVGSSASNCSWALLVFGLLTAVVWNAAYLTTALPVYLVAFAAVGAPGVVIGAGMIVAGALVVPFGLPALLDAQAGLYVLAG